jgi:hypothetical protein
MFTRSYVNMDYFFFSSVARTDLRTLVVSYDIACQWSKNLWKRMASYSDQFQLDINGSTTVNFLVPKFHLPAHVELCQTTYSFNLMPGVGRTDGEAPERGWSHINPVATSTREMGPGSRRDTLDDHFSDWNWKKTTGMGLSSTKHNFEDVLILFSLQALCYFVASRSPSRSITSKHGPLTNSRRRYRRRTSNSGQELSSYGRAIHGM